MTRPPGAASWGSFSSEPDVSAAGPEGQTVPERDGPLSSTSVTVSDDPTGAVAHFLAIPWCRAHLRPAENGPAGATGSSTRIRIVVPATRFRISSPETADNAFTNTLNSPDTISAYVVFYEEPADALSHAPIVELKALMTVGPGMNGHVGVMHGGLVGTILDEVLGLLMPLNQRRLRRLQKLQQQQQQENSQSQTPSQTDEKYSPAEAAAVASATVRHGFVTGFLNTTYVRPVRTSATILVTARFTRLEGPRKFYVQGAIWDEDAQLRAKAEAVFIALRDKL
ncbi:thioesterase superfamily [Grosmannia clavigera kw1407]|uniref:Thioesterase superfamily n=1 Tax=Grosmannia clavigera (strain kw1407 / UAMH 11150) TaxID=655863 RepID=F0XN33_GROCL|nr:thioesterase superfamily [Grosmannia clavigera kw1407]EFX00821.1 thioesterase superfamily [Grosmannia clavigera kw1407]